MKVYGDIEYINLSTGERFRRVSGDGESRLIPEGCCKVCDKCGQPIKPGRHKPGEYEHAQGCPKG